MSILDNAWAGDIETLPNCFTLGAEMLNSDVKAVWEISHYRDDRHQLLTFLAWAQANQTPMIGFNSVGFDYPVLHYFLNNPHATVEQLYAKAMDVLQGERFGNTIWADDRYFPQIDLFLINHFNNKSKSTSLKALQINMRSPTVVDSPVEWGTNLTREQVNRDLVPYNQHDVQETKRFAKICKTAIDFRIGLIPQFGIDALNYNDTKIGEKMLIQRIGEDLCYERVNGRKQPRQTHRHIIALNDIIFPYISFDNPEFQRVLDFMRTKTLTPADLDEPTGTVQTKGVFQGLIAHVGSVDFKFGVGGIHASVPAQRIVANDEWLIRDIDVASLYPNIGIVNRLAPEHLGDAFVVEYSKIPPERKHWQKLKGKKCVEANSLKLGANGAYGKTNDMFSPLCDPKYTMTVTINGQLMLAMLAQELVKVPTLRIIQANTDGITYYIHRDHEPTAKAVCQRWEAFTCLTLEDADYARMWIRDVNNYVGEYLDGSFKLKGAYEYPDPLRYEESISEMQPPGWHKDWSNIISTRAAVAAMIHGVDPEAFIRCHTDPFDFMCRAKVDRSSKLMLGGSQVQSTTRYYVARQGVPLVKVSPPAKGARVGDFKRRNGLTDAEFNRIAATVPPGTHDERIHTKNKSKYEIREMGIEAGWMVAECNDASRFDFANVNYDFYVQEARKLIIA